MTVTFLGYLTRANLNTHTYTQIDYISLTKIENKDFW